LTVRPEPGRRAPKRVFTQPGARENSSLWRRTTLKLPQWRTLQYQLYPIEQNSPPTRNCFAYRL